MVQKSAFLLIEMCIALFIFSVSALTLMLLLLHAISLYSHSQIRVRHVLALESLLETYTYQGSNEEKINTVHGLEVACQEKNLCEGELLGHEIALFLQKHKASIKKLPFRIVTLSAQSTFNKQSHMITLVSGA